MLRLLKIYFLLLLMNPAEITRSQNSEGKTKNPMSGMYSVCDGKSCLESRFEVDSVLFIK